MLTVSVRNICYGRNMRTVRLFLILDRLRAATAPLQARLLAATFEVSERTIYRDIVTLQAIGAPIRGEAGVGYQLEPHFFLPPLSFDADEMDAVRLGLRLTAARGDERLRSAAERAAGKIASVLQTRDHADFMDAPYRAVSRMDRDRLDENDTLVQLRSSIGRRSVLNLTYLDLNGCRSERNCRPLGLTVFDEIWLLTIWCELRQDFRNLRVDRIEQIGPAGRRFRQESGKRFEDYLCQLPSAA